MSAGDHCVVWEADGFPAGVYFIRVENFRATAVRRVMLVR
jgi:hypothetical protein